VIDQLDVLALYEADVFQSRPFWPVCRMSAYPLDGGGIADLPNRCLGPQADMPVAKAYATLIAVLAHGNTDASIFTQKLRLAESA
jgi:hypothetical protein